MHLDQYKTKERDIKHVVVEPMSSLHEDGRLRGLLQQLGPTPLGARHAIKSRNKNNGILRYDKHRAAMTANPPGAAAATKREAAAASAALLRAADRACEDEMTRIDLQCTKEKECALERLREAQARYG